MTDLTAATIIGAMDAEEVEDEGEVPVEAMVDITPMANPSHKHQSNPQPSSQEHARRNLPEW